MNKLSMFHEVESQGARIPGALQELVPRVKVHISRQNKKDQNIYEAVSPKD